MSLHMERRLEVLAKEIAAAKKPKIDWAANAAFDQIAQKPDSKTAGDSKANGAAKVRTIDDVMSDPTDDERDYIMRLRGGCGCSWPNSSPPCGICTDEYTDAEAAEALEETRTD